MPKGGDPISLSTPVVTPPVESKPLPCKQRAFVEFYLQTWNATRAAEMAGYKHPNVQGPRMLVKVSIQAAIEARMAELTIGAKEVLKRLSEQASGDLGAYFKISERWSEWPLPSEEILAEERFVKIVHGEEVEGTHYLVRKVVLDMDAVVDPARSRLVKKFADSPKNGLAIELHDPQAALVHIGRHLKLFTDVQEHTGKDGGPIDVKVSDDQHARAISALADALGDLVSREGERGDGPVDAPEQAPVAGPAEPGG